jgi:hypothetical protein
MQASADEAVAILRDPNRRGEEVSEADAMLAASDVQANLILWRLLANVDVPKAQIEATALLATLASSDPRVPELKSWLALRAGDSAGALAATAPEGSAWLAAAHALASAAAGKADDAKRMLREIESAEPLTALGCWASSRLATMDPKGTPSLARVMGEYARTIPAWVDSVVSLPTNVQRVTIEHAYTSADAMGSVPIIVRVKNLSPVPLGLGAERTIDSRMLIAPQLQLTPKAFEAISQAEVVDVGRKLRLLPGEEVRVELSADDTILGWLTTTASQAPSRLKYRMLQGFTTNAEGARSAGVGSQDVGSGTLQRSAMSESQLPPELLAERIRASDASVLPTLLVATRSVLINALLLGEDGPNIGPLLATIEELYPTWPASLRLAAILELPSQGEVSNLAALGEKMKQERDPSIMSWVLVTRVREASDPFIEACMNAGDANLAKLATMCKTRLEANKPTYAMRGALGVADVGRRVPQP